MPMTVRRRPVLMARSKSPDDAGMTRTTVGTIVLLAAGGCSLGTYVPQSYRVLHLPSGDRHSVYEAALAVLVDQGYEIKSADPITGVITTEPVRARQADASRSPAVRLSAPRILRRIAEVRVAKAADATSLYCKVAIQELVTDTHRILWQDRHATDVPNATAIDRGAGTTREQNMVWQTLRRDRAAERRILDGVLNKADPR